VLENWVNTGEAAVVIGCSDARVRQMLANGEMKGKKVSGRSWLIPKKEAERIAGSPSRVGRPRKSQGR